MTNKHILKCVQHHKTENLSSKKFKTDNTMCGKVCGTLGIFYPTGDKVD